jgi:hypothetical protein
MTPTPSERDPYPWLTVEDDGSYSFDLAGCTPVEQDRRLVIVQELQAGHVVPFARAENADLRSKLDAAEGRIERAREALANAVVDEHWQAKMLFVTDALAILSEPNAEGIASEGGSAANPRDLAADAPSAGVGQPVRVPVGVVDEGCPVCGDEGGDSEYFPGENGRCPACLRADTGYRRTSEGLHPRARIL